MSNPNTVITMTQREKWKLEGKAKQGWRCYFAERDLVLDLSTIHETHRNVANQVRNGEEIEMSHLRKLFLELYDKVGELVDCPVCFTVLTKENAFVSMCGHMVCKPCKENPILTKCPICRKDY